MIYWILLAMALIGAVNVPIYKFAILSLSPILTVFTRAILSFLLILPFVYKQLDFKRVARDKKLFFSNLLFAANWVFFAAGITMSSVFMGILLYVPTAAFVALVNYLLYKEKLSRYQIVGLVLVVFGMAVVALQSKSVSFGNPLGSVLIALGAISWIFYLVFSSRYAKDYSPQVVTSYNFLASILLSMVILPFELFAYQTPKIQISPAAIASLLYTVVFSSILFFFLYQVMIKRYSAFVSSFAIYPPNIAGITVSLLVLKEPINTPLIVGTIAVFTGIFVATTFAHAKAYIRR